MSIPKEINKTHVEAAMDQLGPNRFLWPPTRLANRYDVIHPDEAKR
jgi:hypothetical protein